jgi:hypothetical protein
MTVLETNTEDQTSSLPEIFPHYYCMYFTSLTLKLMYFSLFNLFVQKLFFEQLAKNDIKINYTSMDFSTTSIQFKKRANPLEIHCISNDKIKL